MPIVGSAPKYGIANFVKNLLQRPCNSEDDVEAEKRFYKSLVKNLSEYAISKDGPDSDRINEEKFCELMKTFNTTTSYEFTDEEQYDQFLERLFYRI